MLKLKKILPVVFATALIFSGCGSSEPAADGGSATSESLSAVEEAADETVDEEMLSADGEAGAVNEESQQDDGSSTAKHDEKSTAAENNSTSDNKSSSASDSKSDAAKSSSNSSAKTTEQSKSSESKSASSSTASSAKPAASSSTASAAPAETKAAEPSYKYKDGTYSGSAQGFNGPVGVSVTISKDKITSVSVTSSTDDEPYITNAKALCSKIVSSNSADVSGVSGATYSSNGIKGAVKAALAKAEN